MLVRFQFDIDLNLVDGNTHAVSFYFTDWDHRSRSQKIEILDKQTGALLDSRTVTNFDCGQYLAYDLTGHVVVRVTCLGGVNAVISSVLFGRTATTTTSAATFIGTDLSTQGEWKGQYGSDGFSIAGDGVSLPAYAQFSVSGTEYIWSTASSEVRAPQRITEGDQRVAACWYGSEFDIDLNLADGNTHAVSFYCMDWDHNGRSQKIEIINQQGAVLDSRIVTNFHSGKYLAYDLRGRVRVRVTCLSGANAVISSIFWGRAATATPSAGTFIGTDLSTQGEWKGRYGNDGYSIAGDGTSLPPYAQLAVSGAEYTWNPASSEGRALQRTEGGQRVAACWYGSTFDIDLNLVDGNTHAVSFYCMDWDYGIRSQKIEIIDQQTGATLDKRLVTSFASGKYLAYELRGHVVVRVTCLKGANAVINAIFFGRTATTTQPAAAALPVLFNPDSALAAAIPAPVEAPSAPIPQGLTISQLSGTVSTRRKGRDTVSFSGVLPNTAVPPAGTSIDVTIGGVTKSFKLNSSGRAQSDAGTLQLKGGFKARLKHLDLSGLNAVAARTIA